MRLNMSDEDLEQDDLEAADEDDGEELAAADDGDSGDDEGDGEVVASSKKSKAKAVEVDELPSIEAKQKERDALKEQFGQLVALATAQVTGKVLTEEDQRRINREAIDSLDS